MAEIRLHVLGTPCPRCGGTDYYCAEEVDRRIEELERGLAECCEELAAAEAREQHLRYLLEQLENDGGCYCCVGLVANPKYPKHTPLCQEIRGNLLREPNHTALAAALEAHLREFVERFSDQWCLGLESYSVSREDWEMLVNRIRDRIVDDFEAQLDDELHDAMQRLRGCGDGPLGERIDAALEAHGLKLIQSITNRLEDVDDWVDFDDDVSQAEVEAMHECNKRIDAMLANALKELADARWISVEDRLPEEGGEYLVYWTDYYGASGQLIAVWSACLAGWHAPHAIGSTATLTHWQPLLEPPEEK